MEVELLVFVVGKSSLPVADGVFFSGACVSARRWLAEDKFSGDSSGSAVLGSTVFFVGAGGIAAETAGWGGTIWADVSGIAATVATWFGVAADGGGIGGDATATSDDSMCLVRSAEGDFCHCHQMTRQITMSISIRRKRSRHGEATFCLAARGVTAVGRA